MLKDPRPYVVKRLYNAFQYWYVEHFLRPQFARLGKGHWFMKPWYVEVFGGPVGLGEYAHVIAAPDKRVRLTVWSNMEGQGRIEIGNYCLICPAVRFNAGSSITVGDSCMFANGAFITDSDWHGIYDRSLSVGKSAPVKIGRNVWIGDSAIVCKGVTIGDNSIIGAGSVVLRDIPADVIAGGNPAVVVKPLDPARHMRTRADWYADPEGLSVQFDAIDRAVMKNNSWRGWLRASLFPRQGD
ncbi:MAG: acyltransferase [Syntrophales bacterium]|nr:acyltransferase [Syntrophales bacterium]